MGAAEESDRSRKRRRFIRQRQDTDDEDSPPVGAPTAIQNDATATIDKHETSSIVERMKKPKRYGIAYSSTDRSAREPTTTMPSAAVVRYEPSAETTQAGRFVKATGRAMISEDRHMSAFIDSKLAEIRSSTNTPVELERVLPAPSAQAGGPVDTGSTAPHENSSPQDQDNRPIMQAIASKNNRYRRKYRKRQPVGPSDTDIARDGLVDQIMRDGAIPLYDSQNQDVATTDLADDHDHDAAAAAAFKADFLASMEDKKYARKPVNVVSGTIGPKLGGSRMARERMKAVEDQAKSAPRSDQK